MRNKSVENKEEARTEPRRAPPPHGPAGERQACAAPGCAGMSRRGRDPAESGAPPPTARPAGCDEPSRGVYDERENLRHVRFERLSRQTVREEYPCSRTRPVQTHLGMVPFCLKTRREPVFLRTALFASIQGARSALSPFSPRTCETRA